jgi:DNA-binding response OmpR family regulator
VLVVTARDGRDDLNAVLDAGADEYVTKPSSPENLRARLEIASRRIVQDRARRAAEAELARARWLAGIGETTIALEHEINNPLSALLGHAELLLMEDGLTDDQREQLQIIREQAARIADVVRRLARLKNPQSVEYLAGARMIDLSKESGKTD